MKTILYPEKDKWDGLCERPGQGSNDISITVRKILNDVKSGKDKSLFYYSGLYDGLSSSDAIKVTEEEIASAIKEVPEDLRNAVSKAKNNIEKFHSAQLTTEPAIETSSGVSCWRKSVAIEKVGLYIPGGSAPLFSTLLMLAIPAKLAGCREIIVCTPAGKDGKINPVILFTASLMGISEIFKTGGAQAIAAMAYGTETIPKVYKIFGPGNQFVTKAKELVQQDGIAIDMPAGPSEVLVIADKNADPSFVAADLIAQAEHGPDSQAILATDSGYVLERVEKEIESQANNLSRKNILQLSLGNARLILLNSIEECIEFSNKYAPEHLIINTLLSEKYVNSITNAGSVFLGPYSCESMGDYASGTNHTLPTNGYAKNYSGLSVESFVRKITFQQITREGIEDLGPAVEIMASAEQLDGHRNSVSVRLKKSSDGRY
jgi:histidinol dehydrogenase